MSPQSFLAALSSRSTAAAIRPAKRRVVYAAPGIPPAASSGIGEDCLKILGWFIKLAVVPVKLAKTPAER